MSLIANGAGTAASAPDGITTGANRGLVTAPLFRSADVQTGFYSPGTNQMALASNGVQTWLVSAAGEHTLGTAGGGSSIHRIYGSVANAYGSGFNFSAAVQVVDNSTNGRGILLGFVPATQNGVIAPNTPGGAAGLVFAAFTGTAGVNVGSYDSTGAWSIGQSSITMATQHYIRGTHASGPTVSVAGSGAAGTYFGIEEVGIKAYYLGIDDGTTTLKLRPDSTSSASFMELSSAGAFAFGPAAGGVSHRLYGRLWAGPGPDNGGGILQTSNSNDGITHWQLHRSGLTAIGHTVNGNNYDIVNNTGGVRLASGATAWAAISDLRRKKNISSMSYGLSTLMGIETIRFDYLSEGDNSSRIGFSAQNLLSLIPECVHGTEETQYSVSATDLIPVLVKAIQDQQTLIQALTARVNALPGVSP